MKTLRYIPQSKCATTPAAVVLTLVGIFFVFGFAIGQSQSRKAAATEWSQLSATEQQRLRDEWAAWRRMATFSVELTTLTERRQAFEKLMAEKPNLEAVRQRYLAWTDRLAGTERDQLIAASAMLDPGSFAKWIVGLETEQARQLEAYADQMLDVDDSDGKQSRTVTWAARLRQRLDLPRHINALRTEILPRLSDEERQALENLESINRSKSAWSITSYFLVVLAEIHGIDLAPQLAQMVVETNDRLYQIMHYSPLELFPPNNPALKNLSPERRLLFFKLIRELMFWLSDTRGDIQFNFKAPDDSKQLGKGGPLRERFAQSDRPLPLHEFAALLERSVPDLARLMFPLLSVRGLPESTPVPRRQAIERLVEEIGTHSGTKDQLPFGRGDFRMGPGDRRPSNLPPRPPRPEPLKRLFDRS